MSSELPARQQQLHDLLFGRGDVPIADIYAAMCNQPVDETVQYKQRWVAAYVTALNRNLAGRNLKVEPGALKNTYRLVAIN